MKHPKKYIHIATLVCIALAQVLHSDVVDPNLLRKNRDGEDRPSWWYDLWYESGITVLASLKHKIPEKPDITITIEGEEDEDATKIGFSALRIDMEKVLDIGEGENYLNSHVFKDASSVIIYVYYKFSNRNLRWMPLNVIKDEEFLIIHLSKAGPVLPGKYYIDWTLRSGDRKTVEEIFMARKAATKTR
jgi:hypothetical protein